MLTACTGQPQDATPPSRPKFTVSGDLGFLDVNSFAQDSLGYMWIATLGGLDRFNGYEYQHFTHDATDTTSLISDFVFSLLIDSSHNFWIGTSNGLNQFDFNSQRFERYYSKNYTPIYDLFETHDGQIWGATPNGLIYVNKERKTIEFPYKEEMVNTLWQDSNRHLWMGLNEDRGMAVQENDKQWHYFTLPGNRKVSCVYTGMKKIWWLGTDNGIVFFNPYTHSFDIPLPNTFDNDLLKNVQINFIREIEPNILLIGTATKGFFSYNMSTKTLRQNFPLRYNPQLSPQLHACYQDRQGNIWMGSYDKGFFYSSLNEGNFNTDIYLTNYFKNKFVTRVTEDKTRNLWIATRYEGLYRYINDKIIQKYHIPEGKGFLEDLFIDSKKRIWLAFEHNLIVGEIGKNNHFQIQKVFNTENIRVIKEDREGTIWAGSWTGLQRFKEKNGTLYPQQVFAGNVPEIHISESGDVLFSAYGYGLYRLNRNTGVLFFLPLPKEFTGVTSHCINLFEDSHHRLWMGSYGSGTLCIEGKTYKWLNTENGLPSNNTLCITEDNKGFIWISTSKGIVRIAHNKNKTEIKNYSKADGILGDQFHEKAGCRTTDGRIFFAGNHGITFFNPLNIKPNNTPPAINIEDLKIFNNSVYPGQKKSPLIKDIRNTSKITLNYKQTSISLDYAGIDFLYSNELTYKYILEGFDKHWDYVGKHRRASYSNLPPGKYIFRVCAINADGIESRTPASLEITVKPAPYLSWEAKLFYILCLALIVILLIRSFVRKKLNKRLVEMERNERKREEEISKMKINFFTNISHELRTPLTLIAAPLEQIITKENDKNTKQLLYNTIARNVKRLWQLANQLMDLSKVENGVLKLHVKQDNIMRLISENISSFTYIAYKRKVNLTFQPHVPELLIWVDSDKLEKILYNLLSNAIKHSPKDEQVIIRTNIISIDKLMSKYHCNYTYNCKKFIEIQVLDHGDGIPEEKQKGLFVRYHQIETEAGTLPDYSGNGIGLHYTKTLMETHKGCIHAESNTGCGMIFSFALPVDDIYSDNEKKDTVGNMFIVPKEFTGVTAPNAHKIDKDKNKKFTVLVADDNIELLDFIAGLLDEQYHVLKATDGEEAWQLTQKNMPDLVISDVIMPRCSGYDLCRKIKDNFDYNHILVILLTAKTIISDRIEGLDCGADAYICKPFNIDFLMLSIKNMLKQKENFLTFFATPQQPGKKLADMPFNQRGKIFMEKLTNLIEKELANSDLNVDEIAQHLGISRSVFYRKLKGLTNTSPNNFLRLYRLKRAAEMLLQQSESLLEISEKTGFSSYSYFSKVFKNQYGVSPKDYAKSVGRQPPL